MRTTAKTKKVVKNAPSKRVNSKGKKVSTKSVVNDVFRAIDLMGKAKKGKVLPVWVNNEKVDGKTYSDISKFVSHPAFEKEEMSVCQEADFLVHGEKNKSYGNPSENFDNIARMWSVILKKEVSAHDVGLCMVATKVAREINVHKRDNLVDIAGYAATLERLEKGI